MPALHHPNRAPQPALSRTLLALDTYRLYRAAGRGVQEAFHHALRALRQRT